MKKTNIAKRRIVKDKVFRKILEDQNLRDILMVVTGLREPGVKAFAGRRSQKSVKDIDVVEAIKKYTGWNDEEIFETIEIK